MGFCRRCGEIVHGPLCKCGGAAVLGVVHVNQGKPKTPSPDRWSQTYTRSESPKKVRDRWPPLASFAQDSPTKDGAGLTRRVTALSTVGVYSSVLGSNHQPSSPLKQSTVPDDPNSPGTPSDSQSADEVVLTKVFGTILQPAESLAKFCCAICKESFVPDATIYPDPSCPDTIDRFLCRPCFVLSGGSKGSCVACEKPVLSLKSEGEFVSHGGSFWHKPCFRCRGCLKDLGATPMVDLLGAPCCSDCFDTSSTRRTASPASTKHGTPNKAGMEKIPGAHSGVSPILRPIDLTRQVEISDEILPRTTCLTSRRDSPIVTQVKSCIPGVPSPSRGVVTTRSPSSARKTASPVSARKISGIHGTTNCENRNSPLPSPASTKISSASNTLEVQDVFGPVKGQELFSRIRAQSQSSLIVTSEFRAPDSSTQSLVSRHLRDLTNEVTENIQEPRSNVQHFQQGALMSTDARHSTGDTSPSPATSPRRFGASAACPGCQRTVSPMENGVVQGPQGTRWHGVCLICGGKNEARRDASMTGCGKRLDSGAKTDRDGRIWCRNCLTKLPRDMRISPQVSPIRPSFLSPMHTRVAAPRFPVDISPEKKVDKQTPLTLVCHNTGYGSPSHVGSTQLGTAVGMDTQVLANGLAISEPGLPRVARHMTGNIAKLTQQLTGNGRAFAGGMKPVDTSDLKQGWKAGTDFSNPLFMTQSCTEPTLGRRAGRSPSPLRNTLNSLAEEPAIARHTTGGAVSLTRQLTGGRMSPTKQLCCSPTKGTFRPRPKSVLGMRHNAQKSADEKTGRGMFLVRQMTGSGP